MPPKCTVCGKHYWSGHPCKCGRTPENQGQPEQPVELSERIGKILDVYKEDSMHRGDAIKGIIHWLGEPKREVGEDDRQEAICDVWHAMKLLFGGSYSPSMNQAETLVNTVMERFDIRRRGSDND